MHFHRHAFLGSLVADALAMPVHWYYDRSALRRDYGELPGYTAPRNPHPDSILWRSRYEPLSPEADILHDQARFWGQRGIHYHQQLAVGENTLNFQLAAELVRHSQENGGYDPDAWIRRYIEVMRTPGWHRDTYVEEYHRAFFDRLARGRDPMSCGISDEHIGGLATVPALLFVLDDLPLDARRRIVKQHVGLTHAHANVLRAADTLVRILDAVIAGDPLREAIRSQAGDWISTTKAGKWATQPDEHVIGQRFSPACYIHESMPAALFLAWKYHDDFSAGIRANALVGGDNCHRGAVVGSLLGAANGIPEEWLSGLKAQGFGAGVG